MNLRKVYRTDIDGLRALGVISVILFHLGYLHNGYLGVDIFFVISGYLITGIVFNEVMENKFSILKFYERRIRRIFPLVLFTTTIAFILGLIFMLPDDLENLSQSVFASNYSVNNILMKITSADYWAVKNDYKPLMHTWTLAIEEQFYLFYPILFFFLKGERKRYIYPLLILLTLLSLTIFLISNNVSSKFYLIHFRLYQLSFGGICAIYFSKQNPLNKIAKKPLVLFALLTALIYIIYFNHIESNDVKVILTTLFTAGILVTGRFHFQSNILYKSLLSNSLVRYIGKISFGLYMWHQIVYSFARYSLIDEFTTVHSIILTVVVVLLSIITYYTIENPFRNRQLMKTKQVLTILGVSLFIITVSSLYVYMTGGIIKDVPELGITKSKTPSQINLFNSQDNIHIQYNEDIRKLDIPFSNVNNIYDSKVKVLVIGNSFGRDVGNIFLESSFNEEIELRYSNFGYKSKTELKIQIQDADVIFIASNYPTDYMIEDYNIEMGKVWIIGTKDFGNSNGIHYNKKNKDYLNYRTKMKTGVFDNNQTLKKFWGDKYIDLIELVSDSTGRVLVYTPDGKFISQDTTHLTEHGAKYFAKLLDSRLKEILEIIHQ